jgi:hypothetical protein
VKELTKHKKPASMFIQPMFNYNSEEWRAMVYGWPPKVEDDSTFLLGFAFNTEKYAKEFFDLLRSYNNGEDEDYENNIRLSLITEDPENYSVYIYPSTERENVTNFLKESQEKSPENEILITQLIICKYFAYGEGSSFKTFKDLYKAGHKIELIPFIVKGQSVQQIESIKPIVKSDIKIKHRKLLQKEEMEYQHKEGLK